MFKRIALAAALFLSLTACKPEPPQVSGWVRATPVGAKTGAGYLTITSPASDRLLSVSSEAAQVTLHETIVTDGIMSMRPMKNGVALPADKTVVFAPGGQHLMFTGLKAPFVEGTNVTVVLNFRAAGQVAAKLPVLAGSPESGHDH